MNIQIKRNTFVEPEYARKEVVQMLCDCVINWLNTHTDDYSLTIKGIHPVLFINKDRNGCYSIDEYSNVHDGFRIRGCEMRLAFRKLQEAGYYIFFYEDRSVYYFSLRPYRYNMKAEYIDFGFYID